jgi:DNA-directed RNA polymerase specialized sigma24 family protein
MSSSTETSNRTTGAHRAHGEARDRAAAHTLARRPSARYEPYLDGLFTYCLSVLCDHDAATAALADTLSFAERRGQRVPQAPGDLRAWLYALARWVCLRTLAEAKRKRQAAHAAGRHGADATAPPVPAPVSATPLPGGSWAAAPAGDKAGATAATPPGAPGSGPRTGPAAEEQREGQREGQREEQRAELARLAWPEAAGTAPEQREALELAVRHQLTVPEVGVVLGLDLAATRELLAGAACEVERTRAALAVVQTGTCPSVSRLAGDKRLVLGTALRDELVRHVDDCPRCRRTAERAVPGRWPGAAVTPAELPVLAAPRAALLLAMAHGSRPRRAAPRFDRRGLPMDPKDRAARRERLRARAVTTTVVATVVAAPVLALWAAYRATETGEGQDGRTATARRTDGPGALDGDNGAGYENTGNARATDSRSGSSAKDDVTVKVTTVATGKKGAATKGADDLAVTAATSGDTTLVTLTATGDAPVAWSASTSASWIYLSRASGTLEPGDSIIVKIHVDPLREPAGHWTAHVAIAPAGVVVTIDGYGPVPETAAPTPAPTATGRRHHHHHPRPTGRPTRTPADGGQTPTEQPTADPTPTPTQPTDDPTTTPGDGGAPGTDGS